MSDAEYAGAGWTLADVVRSNIRAEAARRGIEQKDIADYMGWSKSSVSKRFIGALPWRLDELEPIGDLLGLTVQDLVTDWRIAEFADREAGRAWYNQKADRQAEHTARGRRREHNKLPHLDSNQEPADSLLSLLRGVLARLARAWRGRAGQRRGAAPGPVAPVIDLFTRERVA